MHIEDKYILLVEDNADDIELTRRAFKKANLMNRLEIVRDGQEAIDYLFCDGVYADRNPIPPTLVLLDLKLPKVSGIQVLEAIRGADALQHLSVVVLTSSLEQSDLNRCYELHVNSYIQKPVEFDRFIEAVSNLGLYWLFLNERPESVLRS
jgi:two-component system response regulator